MDKLILTLFFAATVTVNAQDNRRSGSVQQQRGSIENNVGSMRGTTPLVPTTSNFNRGTQGIPLTSEWRNMNSSQRRETVRNLSPEDKTILMQNIKENIMIDEIKISNEHQDEFKDLFNQYSEGQEAIKQRFKDKNQKKIENLTNEEAQKKLNESFEIGQQLLDNRKAFAEKFSKILTPQQILKFFQTEGKVRNKVLDKKYDD